MKSYAKLNLTLKITGVNGGYHTLDSVVASIDIYDLIVLRGRKDCQVTVTMHGCGSESIPPEHNNALKAARAFMQNYGTLGVDITVYKNIPLGAGLGGSSADSAGVLKGMAKLFDISDTVGIKLLADSLGSDTKYMLEGGYARLFGRGDEVVKISSPLKANMLLLVPNCAVSTPECYSLYDGLGGENCPAGDTAQLAIEQNDLFSLCKCLKNDLSPAAKKLSHEVESAYKSLLSFSPLAVNITGSGCGVYAVFESAELRDYAKSRYTGSARAIPVKTIIPKN